MERVTWKAGIIGSMKIVPYMELMKMNKCHGCFGDDIIREGKPVIVIHVGRIFRFFYCDECIEADRENGYMVKEFDTVEKRDNYYIKETTDE